MNARSGKATLLTPAAVRHWWKFGRRATPQQGIKASKRGASLLLDYRDEFRAPDHIRLVPPRNQ
ncbi:MAG: hypothetical protein DMG62_24870 [Acidobacteria bacterium]|nr:MAG: hypothetical protein DMG62_24870 [Acidobacteriota bacterium]